jgi:hypothetical protein
MSSAWDFLQDTWWFWLLAFAGWMLVGVLRRWGR